jgi:Arc/MetJ-type ribon-helix-helix transcriptional regulator
MKPNNNNTKEIVMATDGKNPPNDTETKAQPEAKTEAPKQESTERKGTRSGILGLDADDIKALKVKLEDAREVGKAIKDSLTSRDNVVMVRVNDASREKMDMLVDAGIFKSRSECAAFLIHQGIQAQEILFDKLQNKVEQIQKIREELKGLLKIEE